MRLGGINLINLYQKSSLNFFFGGEGECTLWHQCFLQNGAYSGCNKVHGNQWHIQGNHTKMTVLWAPTGTRVQRMWLWLKIMLSPMEATGEHGRGQFLSINITPSYMCGLSTKPFVSQIRTESGTLRHLNSCQQNLKSPYQVTAATPRDQGQAFALSHKRRLAPIHWFQWMERMQRNQSIPEIVATMQKFAPKHKAQQQRL
jgi:hypothetical protein